MFYKWRDFCTKLGISDQKEKRKKKHYRREIKTPNLITGYEGQLEIH